MAEDFLPMLRAANIFPRDRKKDRPFGMVDVDSGNVSSMLHKAGGYVNRMKNEDLRRQKDLLRFQHGLTPRAQQAISAPASKPNVIIRDGGFSPMQEKWNEEGRLAKANDIRFKESALARTESLNQALTLGKQRSEADMAQTAAEINGREIVAKMNKEMAAKAADDARTDKERTDREARSQKGPLVNFIDPDDPTGTKMVSGNYNPVTKTMERVKVDGKQVGTGYKQGTIPKPTVNPGQDPERLKQLRIETQSTLSELDELLDEDGKLRPHTQDAVGKSRMFGLQHIPGTQTKKGDVGINTLKSKLVLGLIGQMKAQSKTGATGFGQMNLKELGLLEKAASKLDPSLDEESFAAELNRIREKLQMIMQDQEPEKVETNGVEGKKKLSADDYLKKHGY